jgi:signal peptidase I
MGQKSLENRSKNKPKKKGAAREFTESLLIAVGIALVIRALVIYPFKIPTGSMEDSLLIGDHLLANKFVYGIRSPDWIGIPFTKIGFKIPFFQTPGLRKPKRGDVVIFKYPRDDMLNYIKRCVAVSGDTVQIRDKVLYINGEVFPNPPKSKFNRGPYPSTYDQSDIYPRYSGNIDHYGPVRVPAVGDTFRFTENNRGKWFEWFQNAVYEGHKLILTYEGESRLLTVKNQEIWSRAILTYPIESFTIDKNSLDGTLYTIRYRHYFMMGDNRDNSADSRYWGFLPERNVVGEALIIYWSWDKNTPFYRLFQKIRWDRLLKLIR